MATSSKGKWFSDNLSEQEIKEELEKKNLLPYFGINQKVLENIGSPSLENLCEAVKAIPIPYEVLISQNPAENIAMYLTALDFKKKGKPLPKMPEEIKDLIKEIRVFYWKNKDLAELYSILEYPLKILPENLHQKRLESLPKPILQELEQAFSTPYTKSTRKCARESAINEISEGLYKIYKQNNQF